MCSPDNVLNKVLIVAGTVEHKVLPRLGIVVLASLRRAAAAAAAAADVDLEVNLSRDNIATLRHERSVITNINAESRKLTCLLAQSRLDQDPEISEHDSR